ncbi:hypothetical protein [Sanyastnella coralliicola]|uniref:hypothetical protein n=1 Tax=Sanyastnella coralliicola TaxID=3069118 RepID=UPI0027BA7225|nr:hypothetical protein [Longitalea sp. SCSIO 12813]
MYNAKRFRPVQNSANGEVSEEVVFEYHQEGNILTCTYSGGQIQSGHLIGLVAEDGTVDMRYHQVNTQGKLMTGVCISTPVVMSDGRIQLRESWEWTSGKSGRGESILEEVV